MRPRSIVAALLATSLAGLAGSAWARNEKVMLPIEPAMRSHTGHMRGVVDTTLPTDPSERALLMCERNAKRPCKLYAVNRSVVWTKEPK